MLHWSPAPVLGSQMAWTLALAQHGCCLLLWHYRRITWRCALYDVLTRAAVVPAVHWFVNDDCEQASILSVLNPGPGGPGFFVSPLAPLCSVRPCTWPPILL